MSIVPGGKRLFVLVVSNATVRSLAAAMMILSRVASDMRKLYGNHLTMSQMRVDNVDGVHILWH